MYLFVRTLGWLLKRGGGINLVHLILISGISLIADTDFLSCYFTPNQTRELQPCFIPTCLNADPLFSKDENFE